MLRTTAAIVACLMLLTAIPGIEAKKPGVERAGNHAKERRLLQLNLTHDGLPMDFEVKFRNEAGRVVHTAYGGAALHMEYATWSWHVLGSYEVSLHLDPRVGASTTDVSTKVDLAACPGATWVMVRTVLVGLDPVVVGPEVRCVT